MDTNSTRARLEEIGLSDEQVDDVISLIASDVPESETPGFPVSLAYSAEQALRDQLVLEDDPIKRAIIAARIISNSLT